MSQLSNSYQCYANDYFSRRRRSIATGGWSFWDWCYDAITAVVSVIADGCVDDGELAVFTGSCVGEVALAIVPGGQLVKAVKVAKTIVVKAVGTTKGVIIKLEAQKKIWQN